MINKVTITQIITSLGAAAALITTVFAIDARYTKDSDLQQVKNDIVGELRTEVTKNRSIMLDKMQLDADDIEFQIMELQTDGKPVPRYLIEKHKHILRSIGKLENDKNNN
jgi:hypothetical protein